MADFSLVPVDHQPDFENVSLVPVDHDPFGDGGITQQVQTQSRIQTAPAQTQPVQALPQSRPQQPATGAGGSQSNAGTAAAGSPAVAQPLQTQTQSAPAYNNPDDEAAMSPETYVNPYVKHVLGNLVTLPQRAIDAARVSFEHNYGPGPATIIDSDVWVDSLPAVALETAMTTMGGVGAPRFAGIGAKGVTGSVAEGAGAKLRRADPEAVFAHARGDAVEGVGRSESGELSANASTGNFYSVLYETKLKPTSYPGRLRPAHNQEGNENLLQDMEGDEAFARGMQNQGVILQRTPTGFAPRTPPVGFSWHHGEEPGVLQLVPREQHDTGSIFQGVLHPDGRGGFYKWGK